MAKRVISAVLTFRDQNFSSGLRKANRQTGDFGREVNAVQNKVENFSKSVSEKFKAVGVAAGALTTGALAGLVGMVGKTILDMDSSFAQLQAQTGLMGTEMESLKQSAIDTFKRGYGESLDEVTNAVARVKQNMHNIDNGEIANVTSNALLLAKTFDSDVNEVTRGVNNMMEAFGVSAEKAFDLFTKGGQSGLNFSNEMFDNVAEYSSLFGAMGYSAEEYFGIISRGSQEGVYNLDYVNDVMKEFQIRTKDGSKATSDAMAQMSSATQTVWKGFLSGNGTVKDVASTVVSELKGMEDQVLANQIGVGLFGTKWEDLESEAMYAMLGSTEAMKDFEGATATAAQSVEGGFVNRVKSSFRNLTTSIAGLAEGGNGKEFLDSIASTAESMVPKITAVADKAMEFGNTIRDNWGPIKETIIGITTAVVAFKVGMMAMTIVSAVTGFISAYRAALATGTVAQWAMNVAMSANPIGLVIAGIAGLIAIGVLLYRNWDTVKAKAQELWSAIKEKFSGIKDAISNAVQPIIGWFASLKDKWDAFKSALSNFKLPGWVSKITDMMGGGVVGKVKDWVQGSFAVGTNRVSHDMTANIHKDEMIIPARQAQKVREAGGTIDNIDSLISQKSLNLNIPTVSQSKGDNTFTFGNIIIQGSKTESEVKEFMRLVKLQLKNV